LPLLFRGSLDSRFSRHSRLLAEAPSLTNFRVQFYWGALHEPTISIMCAFRWLFFVTIAFNIVALGQEGGQPEKDPHRPPCNSAQCRKVKSFVKTHYCGAPEGNGPDDSCQIRQPKKRLNVKVTAN